MSDRGMQCSAVGKAQGCGTASQGTWPQACPGAVETRVNFAGILPSRILQITGAYPWQRLYLAISRA